MQQDLTFPQVIAGLGDLHGRVTRDETNFAEMHGVMDFNATVLSSVMVRVLSLEQAMTTTSTQTAQLGKDA